GMVQRGDGPGLLFEPSQPIGIARVVGGEDLQRDVAAETRVPRAIDLAHAPGPHGRHDLVWPDPVPRGQRHMWRTRSDCLIGALKLIAAFDPPSRIKGMKGAGSSGSGRWIVRFEPWTLALGCLVASALSVVGCGGGSTTVPTAPVATSSPIPAQP